MKKKTILKWRIVLYTLLSLGYYANSFAIDYYWIGKGGNTNWNTLGNWATTSGAAVSDLSFPPTGNDNVIFDENSFTPTNKTVRINVVSSCDSIIFRNIPADHLPTLTVDQNLTVKGSMFLVPGMSVKPTSYVNSYTFFFQSDRPNETLVTGDNLLMESHFNFSGSANWEIIGKMTLRWAPSSGSSYNFRFSSTGSLTYNEDLLSAQSVVFSGDVDRFLPCNIECNYFSKTGSGNMNITGSLKINGSDGSFSGGGNLTIGGDLQTLTGSYSSKFTFSGGGDLTIGGSVNAGTSLSCNLSFTGDNMTVGGSVSVRGPFSFVGTGDLLINDYLTSISNTTLRGPGTKTIKGNLTTSTGIIAENGVVKIQGDLIISSHPSTSTDPTALTGANPNILGGCKVTIIGNIVNNNANAATGQGGGRISVSGAGTVVDVQGGYATLYDLYAVNGGKILGLTETVQCNGGWYNVGGVDFTATTAPKLIRIGVGDLIANAADVYNNVEFFGIPSNTQVTTQGYHTINRGTYNSITFMEGGGRISTAAGITTNRLIINQQKEYIFSNTTTVNDYLEIKPKFCGGTIVVSGGTIDMKSSSTVVAGNLWLKNNKITGATPYTIDNSIDGGGNTGWDFSSNSTSNTYYWVGGTGNWDDKMKWASTSGGTPGSGCVPTLFDNVVFNGSSGLINTSVVTVPYGTFAFCNNMTWSGITTMHTLTIPSGGSTNTTPSISTRLYIGGSLELSAGMKISNSSGSPAIPALGYLESTNGIHFVSNSSETITTNGVTISGAVYFWSGEIISGGTGGWVFQDDWTGTTTTILFRQGSLNFNGKKVGLNFFYSNYTTPRTLNITGSTVTTGYWIYQGTGSNALTNTHTANSLILCSGSNSLYGSNNKFGAKTGDVYNSLEFTPQNSTSGDSRIINNGTFNKITLLGSYSGTNGSILAGTIVTDSLILAAIPGSTYTLNNNITINKYLQSNPTFGLLSNLTSNNTTSKLITMGAAGIAGENVKMKNIKITRVNITDGPMPVNGYPVENGELVTGTETGWDVKGIGPEDGRYYWVGGTGNWNDFAHWSDVSGGPGNVFFTLPKPINTVVFDENSFKAPNCTITVNVVATCDSMLWIGTIGEAPTMILSSGNLTISGSLELQEDMIIPSFNATRVITFNSTRPKESLKTNGKGGVASSIVFNVAGEWDFPDGLVNTYHVTFDGPAGSTPKWTVGGSEFRITNFDYGNLTFNRGTLDLSGLTVFAASLRYDAGADPNRVLIIKDSELTMRGSNWDYNGILTAENSANSTIIINYGGTGSGTVNTAVNQVYNDFNFINSAASTTLNAPAGANTTQFRRVIGPGRVSNGKYQYLCPSASATWGYINGIETDTLYLRSGSNEVIYRFTSGSTNIINKMLYASGNPCTRMKIYSTVSGEPAFVNIKEGAATIIRAEGVNSAYIDFVYVNGIVANQGPGLIMLEKGFGSPDDVTLDGRTYNAMTDLEGWIMDTYDPSFNPFPAPHLPCDAFPYVINPVQFVTTPDCTYEWRKGGETGTILNPGSPKQSIWTINSVADVGEYYLKVTYNTTCNLAKGATITTVTADSLIWTGAVDKDWNNPGNWELPDNGGAVDFAPSACIDVLIPAGLSVYPDLLSGNTDYTREFYDKAACNNIWFEHGGEVVRTDLLEYTKAYVELTLAANRWNMLAAPLRYMYPGDYYKDFPCPFEDKLRIYQQLFAMNNPQNGTVDTSLNGDWTEPFNNPEVAMPAGFGYAIQLLDNGTLLSGEALTNETDWTPLPTGERHSMWFPKNDTEYNIYIIYSSDGQGNPPFRSSCDIDNEDTRQLSRGSGFDNYRFIYESGSTWKTTGDITLTTAGVSDAEKQVIIGNPFMSHWNFSNFYAQNAGIFKEEYKVLDSANDAAFTTYSPLLPSWTSADELIAPMQSVLITSTAAFGATDLKSNVEAMTQRPGNILKSATSDESNLLKIVAGKDDKINWTHILFDAMADNNYDLNEDSYKLFVTKVTEPVAVYTRSQDGIALDINVFGNTKEMIPLGVRTTQTGTINLQFEGADNFYKLYLFDAQNGIKVDLKETPEYNFDKTTSDLFIDGRLFLSIENAPNSDFFPTQGAVSVFTSNNQLQVVSDSNIDEVQVFDMQGRLLHQAHNIRSSAYTYNLPSNGMYVVKVLTGKGVTIKKITTN